MLWDEGETSNESDSGVTETVARGVHFLFVYLVLCSISFQFIITTYYYYYYWRQKLSDKDSAIKTRQQ